MTVPNPLTELWWRWAGHRCLRPVISTEDGRTENDHLRDRLPERVITRTSAPRLNNSWTV